MAFATVSDIASRWRTLDSDEQALATTLLDDAAAMLSARVLVDISDSQQLDLLKIVSCNMVIRAMSATQADNYGASQMSMTAGSYTQSWTYANPSGDMYLTKQEKIMLGIGAGYIGTIRPKIHGGGCDD